MGDERLTSEMRIDDQDRRPRKVDANPHRTFIAHPAPNQASRDRGL